MGGYDFRGAVWKKKFTAALMVSLLMGGTCFQQGVAASSVQTEDENNIQEPKGTASDAAKTETPAADTPGDAPSKEVPPDEKPSELQGLTCLQIPEKLEVVIDPWEIDEKGQVYSEPFKIKNTGDAPGILTLSFTCEVNKSNGVTVRETREEFYDSHEKLIYMKVVFGEGEQSVFTREGAVQCRAKIQPGEELSLYFEGEVNENAEEPWEGGDIEIKGMYSWETVESQSQAAVATSSEAERQAFYDKVGNEPGEENRPSENRSGEEKETDG